MYVRDIKVQYSTTPRFLSDCKRSTSKYVEQASKRD